MTFFAGLARQVVRFRLLVIAGWVVIIGVAMVALPSLGSEVNSDPSLFLSSSAPSVQAASVGGGVLGAKTTSKITIIAARSGPLTQADEAAIRREANLAHQISGVKSVRFVSVSPSGNAVQLEVDVTKNAKDARGLKPVVSALQATFPKAGTPPACSSTWPARSRPTPPTTPARTRRWARSGPTRSCSSSSCC